MVQRASKLKKKRQMRRLRSELESERRRAAGYVTYRGATHSQFGLKMLAEAIAKMNAP